MQKIKFSLSKLLPLLFLLFCGGINAQYQIIGSASVTEDDNENYNVLDSFGSTPDDLENIIWSVTGVSHRVVAGNGTTNCTIQFTSTGNAVVQFYGQKSVTNDIVTLNYNVLVNPKPLGVVNIYSGPTFRCQGGGTSDYNASAANATSYSWSISPASAGSIGTSTGLVTWNSSFSGTAQVSVTAYGANNSSRSASKNVTVEESLYALPLQIDGAAAVCAGNTIRLYTPPAAQTGLEYTLFNASGTSFGMKQATTNGESLEWYVATTGSYHLVVEKPGSSCGNATGNPVAVTIYDEVGRANGSDAERCGTGTVDLIASSGPNGNTIRWYASATGGTALHTGTSYTTPSLSTTTTYYAESYHSTTTCKASTRKAIQAIIDPVPGTASGNNVSRCGTGSLMLTAAPGSNGNTIRWYNAASGGTLLHTGTSYTTPSLSATTTYYAESYHGTTTCKASTRKAIQAQITSIVRWYLDADGDDHADSYLDSCSNPGMGYTQDVLPIDDCDDTNAQINPDTIWYLDADNDNHAASNSSFQGCTPPNDDYTYDTIPEDDCDDSDSQVFEIVTWYLDADGDGHASDSQLSCGSPGPGYVLNVIGTNDCDDNAYSPTNDCTPVDPLDQNYVYTRTYQGRTQNPYVGHFIGHDSIVQNITYFDGLGRPMQQNAIRQSPDGTDIVTHIGYDTYGRMDKEWLPFYDPGTMGAYRTNDLEADTRSYYENHPDYGLDFPNLSGTGINAYSEKHFEPSPLNRVLKQAAPGEDWKLNPAGDDHSIEFEYATNGINEVRLFEVDLSGGTDSPVLAESGFYVAGELYKNVTKDENHAGTTKNHTTEEFTDKQGRVVLKRTYADLTNSDGSVSVAEPHDTYYVYDDFGNLTYVLPPKMEASTETLANINAQMNELGYQYVYDHRNRLVEKRIPGKDWEYIIYNKLDQPIMTQDANQREKSPKEWLFTKYDAFGRVAYTGKAQETGNHSRADIQGEVNAFIGNLWVDQNATSANFGGTDVHYNNGAYPHNVATPMVTLSEVLTINYYDGYDFDRAGTGTTATAFGVASVSGVKGLATGSKVKVLDVTGPDVWITTVTYYDDKGRPIHTYSNNTYLGTVDIVESQLDFTGKPIKVKTAHTRNNTTIVTIDNFTYDHVGRLLSQTQCIGNETLGDECPSSSNLDTDLVWDGLGIIDVDKEATKSIIVRNADIVPGTSGTVLRIVSGSNQELIVFNDYDQLGQLKHKKVGGIPDDGYTTTAGLQTVDYGYNVRGWLKNINDISDTTPDKLFNFEITYNGGTNPLYNGNISRTQWRTDNDDSSLKSYDYTYDALNRIIGATDNTGYFNLGNVTRPIIYDKNGNIERLLRLGHVTAMPDLSDNATDDSDYGTMDDLTYSYGNGNKLLGVADNGDVTFGFKDGNTIGDDYTYDQNGNMTSDLNKGIATNGIEYNHLNQPVKITVSSGSDTGILEYRYTADGTKVQKVKKNLSGAVMTTTDYIGGLVYENGNLKQISTPEGYIEPNGSSWQYVYRYKDVWGNTRITYADDNNDGNIDASSEIRRERNYYPFGLEHKGYNTASYGVENNLKTYQGQEFTNDLGLNVHEWKYRFGDPATGRFWQIDPLADIYVYNSTYAFAENKLGLGIELEGLEQIPTYGMEYKNAKTSEDYERLKTAKQAEAAGVTAGIAAWVVPAVVSAVGIRATGTFLANEAKDEALSQATNGASDVFDLTKMAFKGLKNIAEFGAKKLFGKTDNAADALSSSVDDVTDAFTKSEGAGKLGGLKIDDSEGNFFQVSGNFDGTDFAFQGEISVSDGVLTIDGGDFEGALGTAGFREALASFGKASNVDKVVFNSAKRTTGANPGKVITIEANVKDYFD